MKCLFILFAICIELHANKIAILDPRIQAPGLVTLFPKADYFIISHNGVYDLDKKPYKFYNDYQFNYREDIENINSSNYNILFLVYAVNDFAQKERADVQFHLEKILNILSKNKFEKLVVFANDDHERDPVLECPYINADVWFKRNYSKKIKYCENVVPFPFLIFGWVCPLWKLLHLNIIENEKLDRILWAGSVYGQVHADYLPRDYILESLLSYVTQKDIPENKFMQELAKSKFCLDLNGFGDPNKRTLEIMCTNSLLIQQYKHLVWPFEDEDAFSEETIFKTPEECFDKIEALRENNELYENCLENQIYLRKKYFCKEWLTNYILSQIQKTPCSD